ncbi:hypothetical protein [Methyloglobulus sp.]|uniref:hypothetical protein n=1 Tax=Methyloglobulus sp. TaxID=2518622 RepID=UPI0032B77F75
MVDILKKTALDKKTEEKTKQLKRQLTKQLHESYDVSEWCDSIIAINSELDNIVSTSPKIEFVGLGDEADDCDFTDAKAIFSSLNFCGCTKPDQALKHIKNGLEHIKKRHETEDTAWMEQNELHVFGNEGAATFFYYWADNERLIDHGSSVPGWLDDKGEMLLQRLIELGY